MTRRGDDQAARAHQERQQSEELLKSERTKKSSDDRVARMEDERKELEDELETLRKRYQANTALFSILDFE